MTDRSAAPRVPTGNGVQRRPKASALWAALAIVLGLALTVVGIVVDDLGIAPAIGGILVTAFSLAVALLIFDRQGRQAAVDKHEVKEELGRLESVTARLEQHARGHTEALSDIDAKLDRQFVPAEMEKVAGDRKRDATDETDETDESSEPAGAEVPATVLTEIGVDSETAGKVAVYAGDAIPLRTLSALYNHLSTDEASARALEGPVAKLVPAALMAYRERGRGPRFWYVSTPDSPGPGRDPDSRRTRTLWRISSWNDTVQPVR